MADVAASVAPAPATTAAKVHAPPHQDSYDHFYDIVDAFRAAAPDASGNLPIASYLDAMTKFLRIVDALGCPAIGDLVKKDVASNITKVAEAAGSLHVITVSDLIKAELSDKAYATMIRNETGRGRNSGTVAILWMKRTLQFVIGLVNHLISDPAITLSESSRKSYATTLKKCHPFLTRNIFDAGLRFVPARKVFYENIAGSDHAKAAAGLMEFIEASAPVMHSLIFSYKQNQLETLIF